MAQILTLFLVAIVVLFAAKLFGAASNAASNENSRLQGSVDGLESVITPEGLQEQIVVYRGMTVSFNKDLHIPNWVAWELTREETGGTSPRAKKFMNDPDVPGCPYTSDYVSSGYDRGHMAPAADMKWDAEAMEQSFYLTNICPQAKILNTGTWKKLEDKCRQWAEIDSAIIIVCGPVLTDGIDEYIGQTRVAVPKRFFKVILSPYADPPRGIGFIMPNGQVPGGMEKAALSIDEVEQATGYDFFSALDDEIEEEVESQCRFYYWSNLGKKKKHAY